MNAEQDEQQTLLLNTVWRGPTDRTDHFRNFQTTYLLWIITAFLGSHTVTKLRPHPAMVHTVITHCLSQHHCLSHAAVTLHKSDC